MDFGSQPQADIRIDNPSFSVVEDITLEEFMAEFQTPVQATDATHILEPNAGQLPHDEEHCHTVEYVPDGCHLHNEGSPSGDDDEDEVGPFISLANMCRDEQLFTSYYESLHQQQQDQGGEQQQSADMEPERQGSGSGQLNGDGSGGSKKRRKFSHVVEERSATDANPLREQETVGELHDLQDLEDLEGLEKTGIKYTPFKLTRELPVWKPGDIFKD